MFFKSLRLRMPDWVHFGFDTVKLVGPEAKRLGAGRVMVLTDPGVVRAGLHERVEASLRAEGLDFAMFDRVEPEPSVACLEEACAMARDGRFDVFVGLGGGSSMDTAKVVAAQMKNDGAVHDYFGVDKVSHRGLPSIMVTTTSGTGSEVTRMAVFTDPRENLKRVVSAQNILANVAITDPSLTLTMPPSVTASTGIDAFIHAAEAYIAVNANPITDVIALESLRLITESLPPAFANGADTAARYQMSLGSLMAGIALNNAGAGAAHALGYPIGSEYHVSHGISLTVILPETMRACALAHLPKYRRMAEAMGCNTSGLTPWEAVESLVAAITNLIRSVKLPWNLTQLKADHSRVKEWTQAAFNEKRLLGNTPRNLTFEDIAEIFEKSF